MRGIGLKYVLHFVCILSKVLFEMLVLFNLICHSWEWTFTLRRRRKSIQIVHSHCCGSRPSHHGSELSWRNVCCIPAVCWAPTVLGNMANMETRMLGLCPRGTDALSEVVSRASSCNQPFWAWNPPHMLGAPGREATAVVHGHSTLLGLHQQKISGLCQYHSSWVRKKQVSHAYLRLEGLDSCVLIEYLWKEYMWSQIPYFTDVHVLSPVVRRESMISPPCLENLKNVLRPRKQSHPLLSCSALNFPYVPFLVAIAKVNVIQDKETVVSLGSTKFALMSSDSR